MNLVGAELQQPCSSASVSGCRLLGWATGKTSATPGTPGGREATCGVEARQLSQELLAPVHQKGLPHPSSPRLSRWPCCGGCVGQPRFCLSVLPLCCFFLSPGSFKRAISSPSCSIFSPSPRDERPQEGCSSEPPRSRSCPAHHQTARG